MKTPARRAERWLADASIAIDGRPDVHCVLEYISDGGARLSTDLDVAIPKRFTLKLKRADASIDVREVELQVRHRNLVGVLFMRGL